MTDKDRQDLAIIHNQLKMAWRFIKETPTYGKSYRTAIWWAGDFPAHIELYHPEDWEEANKTIREVWDEFIYELENFDPERAEMARQLPIADALITASEWAE